MPETVRDSRPVAVTRFDRGAGTLKREGVFPSLVEADRHIRAVSDALGILLREPVQVDRDGLGSASLLDPAGNVVVEFCLVSQVSNEFGPTEGVAVFGVSADEDEVGKRDFRNLLEGFSADGTKRLVQNAGAKERRAGFDLTWSLPKTASILWSQGSLEQRLSIEQAAERALQKVLGVVEEFCGVTRRGKRGTTVENAGLVAAIFRHETARAVAGEIPDPNLHFHFVLLNLCVREDGSTGSLDARALFRPQMKMALGALFRAELAKELERLGLATYRPTTATGRRATWFEIEGIPKSLQQEFSKRRQEITAWMEERGVSGAKAAEAAAKATRRGKENWTRDELQEAWREVGREHGLDADRLFGQTSWRSIGRNGRNALIENSIESIMAGQSRFSELELLRRVAEASPGTGLGIDEIRANVWDVLGDRSRVVPLAHVSDEPQLTTLEMLAIERRLLDAVDRSQNALPTRLDESAATAVLNRYETLRAEQASAAHAETQTSPPAIRAGPATRHTASLCCSRQWSPLGAFRAPRIDRDAAFSGGRHDWLGKIARSEASHAGRAPQNHGWHGHASVDSRCQKRHLGLPETCRGKLPGLYAESLRRANRVSAGSLLGRGG